MAVYLINPGEMKFYLQLQFYVGRSDYKIFFSSNIWGPNKCYSLNKIFYILFVSTNWSRSGWNTVWKDSHSIVSVVEQLSDGGGGVSRGSGTNTNTKAQTQTHIDTHAHTRIYISTYISIHLSISIFQLAWVKNDHASVHWDESNMWLGGKPVIIHSRQGENNCPKQLNGILSNYYQTYDSKWCWRCSNFSGIILYAIMVCVSNVS